jgi:hypothetical protein
VDDTQRDQAIEGVNRRNTVTIEEALREMRAKLATQQERIDGLVKTVSGLLGRQSELEQNVAVLRGRFAGNGPTS